MLKLESDFKKYKGGIGKMNYYLDFDYTLFDTYNFRKGLYEILEANGFNQTHLSLTPEYNTNGNKLLNIKELFINLANSRNIPIDNFLKPLEELYARCAEFVYDDTIEFLKYLKSNKHNIHILTWGDRKFQEEKVLSSKLDKYIDGIIYAENLKYTLENVDYKNGIFIDDSIRDLEGLYNQNAKRVFRIKRENGKNSNKELHIKEILEFDSLKELQEYLEKNPI